MVALKRTVDIIFRICWLIQLPSTYTDYSWISQIQSFRYRLQLTYKWQDDTTSSPNFGISPQRQACWSASAPAWLISPAWWEYTHTIIWPTLETGLPLLLLTSMIVDNSAGCWGSSNLWSSSPVEVRRVRAAQQGL